MKTYTYYWDYENDSIPMDLDEVINGDDIGDVLKVSYRVDSGRICIESVIYNHKDILTILDAMENTKKLVSLAESHQMKLSVGQMYKNYPHLAKTPTVEEQVEMLKLK